MRINFYSTMVLLALIPKLFPWAPNAGRLLYVLSANTGIVSLCMFVTAIRRMFANELSLFHAIFVQHIILFVCVGILPVGECPSVSRPFVSRSDL
jgi:hypothetical protein